MFDSFTLFAANAIVLTVTAIAFWLAGRDSRETFWHAWSISNILLAAAVAIYMFDENMPPVIAASLPNGLLVLGFGIKLHAARRFNGLITSHATWIVPMAIFIVFCAYPIGAERYGAVFTITNVLLTTLAAASALEFTRSRNSALPSRLGLVVAYSIIAASFGVRVVQGVISGDTMPAAIPNDMLLTMHLLVALFHAIGAGAFGLSIAYEKKTILLRDAARLDPLTGLLNRGAFESDAQARLRSAGATSFAVALIDLDHFKSVNDRFGHAGGDAALIAVARILASAPGCIAGRIGGEEFALFMHGESADEAPVLIEHLLKQIERMRITMSAGQTISITASAGLCHSTIDEAGELQELMRIADRQLYRAKDNGRNRAERHAA